MGLIPTTQQVEMEFKVRFLNLNIPKIREEVEENRKKNSPEEKWKPRKILETIITPPEISLAHHVRHFWEIAVIVFSGEKEISPQKQKQQDPLLVKQ